MRISAFVDGINNRYSVFVDDWRCSPIEVNMIQRTYTGWTAFVYQLPDALQFLFWCDSLWATLLYIRCSRGERRGNREYSDFQ